MSATRSEWCSSVREALATVEFRHGSRRAFGRPEVEMALGTTTFIAREDEVTGVIAFTRYAWDPHAPTWAKPLATDRLIAEPRGVIWKAATLGPFEVVA